MHSSTNSAHTTDITHLAVQLPDVSKQSRKQKMHGSSRGPEVIEDRQTWLLRSSAPGMIKLWLDGDGTSQSVEATVEVWECIVT